MEFDFTNKRINNTNKSNNNLKYFFVSVLFKWIPWKIGHTF